MVAAGESDCNLLKEEERDFIFLKKKIKMSKDMFSRAHLP